MHHPEGCEWKGEAQGKRGWPPLWECAKKGLLEAAERRPPHLCEGLGIVGCSQPTPPAARASHSVFTL